MNDLKASNPHFILVPFMAHGHMIPMVDLAHLLANRGALVSFITTPVNAARIKPTIDRAKLSNLPITFVELNVPCTKFNLPEGCENVDLLPSPTSFKAFFQAVNSLQDPLQLYLQQCSSKPRCIISDFCQPWTAEVANVFNIPRFIFHGPSCFFLLCTHNISQNNLYDSVSDDNEPVVVPDLPEKIEITRAQAPGWFPGPDWVEIQDKTLEAEATSDGIVVNTFYELESEYLELYGKALGKRVWPIGPFSLYNKGDENKVTRGKKASIDEFQVLSWLNSMKPKSVIYVNFGSLIRHRPSQLIEIGRGLEASKQPFIWVIKEGEKCEELEKLMLEGFEERTRERGLIITGWAPQMMILTHRSVGGFITHCGWNSILEAISAGVPMLTWPHYVDQFLNEKLVVEVLKIGVAIGVKVPCYMLKDDKVVNGSDVEKAVLCLMDGGEEGEARRERAKELGDKARKSMEGGSSYENLTSLIQFVLDQKSQ